MELSAKSRIYCSHHNTNLRSAKNLDDAVCLWSVFGEIVCRFRNNQLSVGFFFILCIYFPGVLDFVDWAVGKLPNKSYCVNLMRLVNVKIIEIKI